MIWCEVLFLNGPTERPKNLKTYNVDKKVFITDFLKKCEDDVRRLRTDPCLQAISKAVSRFLNIYLKLKI